MSIRTNFETYFVLSPENMFSCIINNIQNFQEKRSANSQRNYFFLRGYFLCDLVLLSRRKIGLLVQTLVPNIMVFAPKIWIKTIIF